MFLKDELLKDLEYGGTPKSRALINLNVAFQELKGEPVTTNFGPPRGGAPPPAPGRGSCTPHHPPASRAGMTALLVATLIGVFITPDGIVIGTDTALSNLGGQVASQQKYCITGPGRSRRCRARTGWKIP